jgi:pterin-4a-carbinolamine dehydratase
MLNLTKYKLSKTFCNLLGNFISRKSGQKCCVYGQNGKPLSKEVVEKFLLRLKTNNELELSDPKYIHISEYEKTRKLINWEQKDDYTKLIRLFYFRNVFLLTDFIKEIYNLDYISNLHQIPNISVSNQEVFKVELHTPALKGLSFKDLQLATAINSLNFEKFKLVPLHNENNYRREIRSITIEDERQKSENEINERSRFKNKYDALIYENNTIPDLKSNEGFNYNDSIKEPSGCSNPHGCACKQSNKTKYEL